MNTRRVAPAAPSARAEWIIENGKLIMKIDVVFGHNS